MFSSTLFLLGRMLNRDGSIETLVVSIAGVPPTEKEWTQAFTRMTGKFYQ